MIKNLKNAIGGGAFWMVNKTIARHIKDLQSVFFLSYLINKEDFHRIKGELMIDKEDSKEYFFATSDKIESATTLSYKQQKRCIKILTEHNFINSKLKGVPAKIHFALNHEEIFNVLFDNTKEENKMCPKVNTGCAQRSIQDVPKGSNRVRTEYKEQNNKNINKGEFENSNLPTSTVTSDGKLKTLKEQFDEFYKKFPGAKRTAETEMRDLFHGKHQNDWKTIIPKLNEAIEKQNEVNKIKADRNEFVPQSKTMRNWLDQSCWEIQPDIKDEINRIKKENQLIENKIAEYTAPTNIIKAKRRNR